MNKTDDVKLELPFDGSWWIDPGRIIGGPFPGTPSEAELRQRLGRLLDVGVRTVINLQVPNEIGRGGVTFPNYVPALAQLAAERGVDVEVQRFPVRDLSVPTPAEMEQILGALDAAVRGGRRVYVHCWGGHGRTGTVAGCWLMRCGADSQQAMDSIKRARRHEAYLAESPSPQTDEQRAFVRSWRGGPAQPGEGGR